jgi:hypothetical protein
VDDFLRKGANLMWAGVADLANLDPESIQTDDVVVIRDSKTNQVIAIGALACAISDVQPTDDKPNKKVEGIAAYVLHVEGDSLWKAGCQKHNKPKFDKRAFEEEIEKAVKKQAKKEKKDKKKKKKDDEEEEEEENPEDMMMGMLNMIGKTNDVGFAADKNTGKKVAKLPGGKKFEKVDKAEKAPAKAAKKTKESKKGGKAWNDEDEEEAFPIEEDVNDEDDEDESENAGPNSSKNKRKGKKVVKKAVVAQEASKEDIKIMDDAIMEAFLNACKISVNVKELPMDTGKFWTNHMIPCRGTTVEALDWKNTSYKKVNTFQLLNIFLM